MQICRLHPPDSQEQGRTRGYDKGRSVHQEAVERRSPQQEQEQIEKQDQNQTTKKHAQGSRGDETCRLGGKWSRVAVGQKVTDEPERESIIMATDSTSPDDDVAAIGVPPRPSSPGTVSAWSDAEENGGGTDVGRSTAAPLVKDAPRHETKGSVLPFYQRKGFTSIMIAVTLLTVGVAVVAAAAVLLSNNIDGYGGTNTSSDHSQLPVLGEGGAKPQTYSEPEDPVSVATVDHRSPASTTNVPSSDPTKKPTSPTSNVSRGM